MEGNLDGAFSAPSTLLDEGFTTVGGRVRFSESQEGCMEFMREVKGDGKNDEAVFLCVDSVDNESGDVLGRWMAFVDDEESTLCLRVPTQMEEFSKDVLTLLLDLADEEGWGVRAFVSRESSDADRLVRSFSYVGFDRTKSGSFPASYIVMEYSG
eukprot:TRINITY_DN3087_c0_g1_i1.p1 TRINITY_DN3087_c0_g1~~TRINITY_DN3087_c0_g1_i1.p1  ORF type:complete len:155 (-),score=46.66 TRINITY_DN3087_c0_g1_i1:504-968(-)